LKIAASPFLIEDISHTQYAIHVVIILII